MRSSRGRSPSRRVQRTTSASLTAVLSLGTLYLTVVVLAVLLSRELGRGPERFQVRLAVFFALLGMVVSAVLLGIVALNLVRLFRDRRRGVAGSMLKSKLSVFFLVVVGLSAIPQGVLSVNFLSSAKELLFHVGTEEALSQGLTLALAYHDRHVRDLRHLAAETDLEQLLVPERSPPEGARLWANLQGRLPSLAAVQIFDRLGRDWFFAGRQDLRLERLYSPALPGETGPKEEPQVRSLSQGDGEFLRLDLPLDHPSAGHVIITTALPEGFERASLDMARAMGFFQRLQEIRPLFGIFAGLVYGSFFIPIMLMAVLTSFFLADRIIRPIESLEEATRRVAEGDYSVRILGRPSDDLGLLVISFNNMVTDLDRARRRMAQAEKVQAWQEIAQRLAHEVKNPLTPIRLATERLRRKYQTGAPDFPEVLERTVDTILREVDTLSSLLNEFRSFARLPLPSFAPVLLKDLVREAVSVFQADHRITIDTAGLDPGQMLLLDAGLMRQVIVNLVTNAAEASPRGVIVRFHSDLVRKSGKEYCRLRVEDNGPGVAPDLEESIFLPYVTGKRDGTGLGLAIVERIIFDHRGRISCETTPGSGTVFVIDLPLEECQETRV
ncbi:sensor histidine kinase [Alkalispirochaeta sphaeroplastigenens]|uniref:sensor histidine kinase n=1 Tax=Alkalispirochaeta sphaeroplastigenens TaxID=1187066 RepID=UPI0015E16582|nr:ATP-binding protein [Alkalispirochaeta sphaeroplastigenens]